VKKLIIAITAIAVIGIGGSAAHAQSPDPTPLPGAPVPLPIECSERDEGAVDSNGDGIPDNCVDFYIEQEGNPPPPPPGPGGGSSSPPPAPGGGSSSPPGTLPRTGSGPSLPLQLGAVLLVMGGIAIVATKRRGPATAG
jgi:LPXTG-motif cell wall-anchored protein